MRTLILLPLAALLAFAAETPLGKPLTLKESVSIEKVLATPADYVGKVVQVKGKVTEVCQMVGCWMALVQPGTEKMIRIKVPDGDIMFPRTAVGKTAVAEGTLAKFDLTQAQAIAQAKHEAEEQGRKFDPASVKSGKTVYQIQGTGAVLID